MVLRLNACCFCVILPLPWCFHFEIDSRVRQKHNKTRQDDPVRLNKIHIFRAQKAEYMYCMVYITSHNTSIINTPPERSIASEIALL